MPAFPRAGYPPIREILPESLTGYPPNRRYPSSGRRVANESRIGPDAVDDSRLPSTSPIRPARLAVPGMRVLWPLAGEHYPELPGCTLPAGPDGVMVLAKPAQEH